MKKRTLIILLVLLTATLLTSCSTAKNIQRKLNKVDSYQADKCLVESFKYLKDKDYDSFDEIFNYNITQKEFTEIAEGLSIKEDEYILSYKLGGYNSSGLNGTMTYKYNYNIETSEKNYACQIVLISENSSPREYMGFSLYEGQLDQDFPEMLGISPWQTAILVYSALCWALIIFAIVKSAKSKVRLKWLWIIGIIIQHGIVITKTTSSISYSVQFFYIGFSQLILTPSGSYYSMTVVFPIVALVFLLFRKTLERKKVQKEQEIIEQEAELNRISEERIKNGITRKSEILGNFDDTD